MRLDKKVALITGGGSGVGKATAILFASEGAHVAVADINLSQAQETVKSIKSASGKAIALDGNVAESRDAEHMVQSTVCAYGRLDILVNSAGIAARNALESEASQEEIWDKVIDVNLKGTYLVSWHAVPEMKRVGSGSIVNLSSIMGLVGYNVGFGGGFSPYPPSKGGVIQLTKNLAIDCAKDNIRVNCICPGYLKTPLTEPLTDDLATLKALESKHPLGRLGLPKEIAYAALFLASDEASFVTGTPLVVDGGYTAQ